MDQKFTLYQMTDFQAPRANEATTGTLKQIEDWANSKKNIKFNKTPKGMFKGYWSDPESGDAFVVDVPGLKMPTVAHKVDMVGRVAGRALVAQGRWANAETALVAEHSETEDAEFYQQNMSKYKDINALALDVEKSVLGNVPFPESNAKLYHELTINALQNVVWYEVAAYLWHKYHK